jgi:hypothetical protein
VHLGLRIESVTGVGFLRGTYLQVCHAVDDAPIYRPQDVIMPHCDC